MSKRRSGFGETCPRVTFRRREPPKGSGIRGAFIEAVVDRESVGHAIVVKTNGVPYVSDVRVFPKMQRCGLGTQLYEQAAQFACAKFKQPLHSDVERSAMSDNFWRKQVQKGRAVCTAPARSPASDVPDWVATTGRSSCSRFRLTCPAPMSLAKRYR